MAPFYFLKVSEKLMTFDEQKDDLTDKIDFIVCLGGDGTLLVPPSYKTFLFVADIRGKII